MMIFAFAHVFIIFFKQQACGFEYTNKLQRMFSDIALADEANKSVCIGFLPACSFSDRCLTS
jgi:hypothetical protein